MDTFCVILCALMILTSWSLLGVAYGPYRIKRYVMYKRGKDVEVSVGTVVNLRVPRMINVPNMLVRSMSWQRTKAGFDVTYEFSSVEPELLLRSE